MNGEQVELSAFSVHLWDVPIYEDEDIYVLNGTWCGSEVRMYTTFPYELREDSARVFYLRDTFAEYCRRFYSGEERAGTLVRC